MTVYSNVTGLIRCTPLVRLSRIAGGSAAVIAKLKFCNPANSIKDRIGAAIIEAAEASGELKPGGTIVEGTSGNVSIVLAIVGTTKGYKVVLAVPGTVSLGRRALLRAYGAELILTPGPLDMKGAVAKAEEVTGGRDGILIRRFANLTNLAVHRHTTAEEIWVDADDKADISMAGMRTGNTVSRAGQMLKEHKPEVKIIVVGPAESPTLSSGQPGSHKIRDLGVSFVPEILDRNVIDKIITRNIGQSIELARAAATREGLLVGIPSGTVLSTAVEVVDRPENADKTIVAVLPGFDKRYLSTILFEGPVDAWFLGQE